MTSDYLPTILDIVGANLPDDPPGDAYVLTDPGWFDALSASGGTNRTLGLLTRCGSLQLLPLVWIVAPALEQDAQELPGSALQPEILAEGLSANPTFFIGPIQNGGPWIQRDLNSGN